MANKYDLKTVYQLVDKGIVTDLGIGAVPKNKTRFITFVKQVADEANALLTISEGSNAITAVTTKDVQDLASDKATIMYPSDPNVDNPIMSIASENFLVLTATTGNSHVTVGYFDE